MKRILNEAERAEGIVNADRAIEHLKVMRNDPILLKSYGSQEALDLALEHDRQRLEGVKFMLRYRPDFDWGGEMSERHLNEDVDPELSRERAN
jgi:hypothetical protein